MGLEVRNKGINNFGLVSLRRKPDDNTDWMVSFGASHVGQDMGHDNPDVDVMNLPFNSSQEYNPNIARNNRSWQSQGSFHKKTGKHDFKIGFFLDESNGRESYQMIPGSDLAMNALFAADPRLAPSGSVDGTDILGNPQYFVSSGDVPVLRTTTKRRNRSLFLQDDWKPTDRFAVNYGARWDSFFGSQNLDMEDSEKSMISPRVNLAYQHDHRTVFKASYNRLFQAPPMVQGELIGATPKVATSDQFDLTFERSLGPTSSMRITAYKKTTDDFLYIRQLIPGLQDGPFSGVNYEEGKSQGIELSMQMTPIDGKGFSGFLTWTNGGSEASGMGSDGSGAPSLPSDQRNTITAGFNYMWANGSNWALSWDFGSGMPTTDLYGLGVGLDERPQQSRVNFRFQSSQTALGPFGGFTIDIENLFDSNTVIGFNSPVNGSTFQQGRRIVISAFSQFLTR
jgi:outer membrane receptor protein involved in Fe transport